MFYKWWFIIKDMCTRKKIETNKTTVLSTVYTAHYSRVQTIAGKKINHRR